MAQCADINLKHATAILIEFPDSHFRNTVITCGRAGPFSYRAVQQRRARLMPCALVLHADRTRAARAHTRTHTTTTN